MLPNTHVHAQRHIGTSYNLNWVSLLGIGPRIRTVAPHGREVFGRGETPDLRKRRKRLNTRKAGHVTHEHYRAGELVRKSGYLNWKNSCQFFVFVFLGRKQEAL